MAATYDSSLGRDRDWVRFLTGDRGPNFVLSDEEIDALLAAAANKYIAAADALSTIRDSHLARGVKSKDVDDLSIEYQSVADYNNRIKELRARGARELQPRPKIFRILEP